MTDSTDKAIAYICANCRTTFSIAPGDDARCPNCLRSSGLLANDPTAPNGAPERRSFRLLATVAIIGLALGLFYLMSATDGVSKVDLTDRQSTSATPSASALDLVPESLTITPQAIDGAVQLAAESLPRDAAGVLSAVKGAIANGNLPTRPVDDALEEAPRSAGELARALTGRAAEPSGPFEQAILLGALLDARSLGPVTYGIDDEAPEAATDIARRRYLVRAGTDAWLALDDQPVPKAVRALDEAGFLANALAYQALAAIAVEDMDGASKASQAARSLAPTDAAILFVAGQVQVFTGLAEPGLATMERAAGIRADGRTWFALGVMAVEANQPFKARQYLLRATETSTEAEPHLLLAQLVLERLQTTPKEAHPDLLKEATAHVERAEAANPEAPGLTTMKAQFAALTGQMEEAEEILRAAAKAKPTDEALWLDLHLFLMNSGREREGMEALREGVDAGAQGSEIHFMLGVAMAKDGRGSEAIASIERSLEIDPTESFRRILLAQVLHESGDTAGAMTRLREEIALKGGQGDMGRLLLAQLLLGTEKPGEAKALVDQILATTPDHKEAILMAYLIAVKSGQDSTKQRAAAIVAAGQRSTLAQVLLEQGFIEEGEKVLREAVVEESHDPLGAVLLAALLLGTGRGDEATKVRDETLARTPEGEQRDNLARLFDTAFQQARLALEAQPLDAPPTPPEAPPATP